MDLPDVDCFLLFVPPEFVEVDGAVFLLVLDPRREVFVKTLLCCVFVCVHVLDLLLEDIERCRIYNTFLVDLTLRGVSLFIF